MLFVYWCCMLTIYTPNGDARFSTPINIGSKRVQKLMGDDYITLKFKTAIPVYFELGDYCDVPGFGRFELCSPYKPNRDKDSGAYVYELRLDAQHIKWRNKIMRFQPHIGGAECSFSLTATADVHLAQILNNIHALAEERTPDGLRVTHPGYLYNGSTPYEMSVDWSVVEKSAKTIDYEKVTILNALTALAEKYECEWWLDNNTIHLGKCDNGGEYTDLYPGDNTESTSGSSSTESKATRLIVFGSDRNISPRYRKDLLFDVKDVAAGAQRVSDTSRPLLSTWFDHDLVESTPENFRSLAFLQSKSADMTSAEGGWETILSQTLNLEDLRQGRWRLELSEFKPVLTFTNRKGECSMARVVCRVTGVSGGAMAVNEEFANEIYIHNLGDNLTPNFSDQYIESLSFLDSVSVKISYEVLLGAGASVHASVSPSPKIRLVLESDTAKVENLTLDIIGDDGQVLESIGGCCYNPDNKELQSERNWIALPKGASLPLGTRFRIREIISEKVKSSYFSEKYCAYTALDSVSKSGIVTKRLMLPESLGTNFIDLKENTDPAQAIEEVVVFEDVYPKCECTVVDVEEVQRKEQIENDDGSLEDKTYTAFRIRDDFFTDARPFSKDYILEGKTLEIKFLGAKRYEEGDAIPEGLSVGSPINPEAGKLEGWTFEVKFVRADNGSAIWEIVRDNNSFVPNDVLRPCVGDKFALLGINTMAVNEACVPAAEEELLKVARRYVAKRNIDATTYTATLMSDYAKAHGLFRLGDRINYADDANFVLQTDDTGRKWGRKSRIIGLEVCLDIPHDSPVYTIGEKPAYSRFGDIQNQVDALKYAVSKPQSSPSGNEQTASGGKVYIITQTDITPPSDTNVFSALRSKMEFPSKKGRESILAGWDFADGLSAGNYKRHSTGSCISANGNAEFRDIEARGRIDAGAGIDAVGTISTQGSVDALKAVGVGGEYVAGVRGGRFWMNDLGEVHLETDYLAVRKKFSAREVEIQEQTHVGGCQIISPAAMRCSRVILSEDKKGSPAYMCCFACEASDGTKVYNQFQPGDLARCQTFNLATQADGTIGNRYYWREVLECGYIAEGDEDYRPEFGREGFILLADEDGKADPGSDIPMAGDRIVTIGNRRIADRQNLIVIASAGEGSPYFYQFQGIDSFSLATDKLKVAVSPRGNRFTGSFKVINGDIEEDILDTIGKGDALNSSRLDLTNDHLDVLTQRTDGQDRDIARLTQTADALSLSVESSRGVISDILNGAGRNLLLHTNRGETGWRFNTNSSARQMQFTAVDNSRVYGIDLSKRNDAAYEVFLFDLRPEIISEGVDYTLSFDITATTIDGAPLNMAALICNPNSSGALTNVAYFSLLSGVPKHAELHLKASASGLSNGSQKVYIEVVQSSLNRFSTISIYNLKLERGNTATPWSAAPEDSEEEQYEKLCAQIKITTGEIRQEVSQNIAGLDEAHKSLISVKAGEILQQVSDKDNELGEAISEIRQTANAISLKVENIIGNANLVAGNSDGIGWRISDGYGGIYRETAPVNGWFEIYCDSIAPIYLRTSTFALKPNTAYTLSFQIKNGEAAPFSYGVRYGDNATALFVQKVSGDSLGEFSDKPQKRVICQFTTGPVARPDAFVEFAHTGLRNGAAPSTILISEVMVEEGNTAHLFSGNPSGLLGTGIDIERRKMVFTSDNIVFQTNTGEISMFIGANGHILAKFIDVDNLTVKHLIAGDAKGERIEIDPQQKSVAIYDAANKLRTNMTGTDHPNGAADLYGGGINNTIGMAYAPINGNSLAGGFLEFNGKNASVSEEHDFVSNVWHSDECVGVVLSQGTVVAKAISKGFTPDESSPSGLPTRTSPEVSIQVTFYLDVCPDEYFSSGVQSFAVTTCGASACAGALILDEEGKFPDDNVINTFDLTGASGASTVAGYCRLRMHVSANLNEPNEYLSLAWGVNAGLNLEAQWNVRLFQSNHFANGFCVGVQGDRFVSAHHGRNGHMEFRAEDDGAGIKVANGQISILHNRGAYCPIPKLIWRGRVVWNENRVSITGTKSFDGARPGVSKSIETGVTRLTLSFPRQWTSLGLNADNTLIHLTSLGGLQLATLSSINPNGMVAMVSSIIIKPMAATKGDLLVDIFLL